MALGQLQDPATIPALARAANQQVRINWKGKPDYEFSSVRMAAALALKQMMPKFSKDIHKPILSLSRSCKCGRKEMWTR